MAIYEACLVADIFILTTVLFSGIMMYFKWKYIYWQRLNIPYLTPSMPFGNLGNVLARNFVLGTKLQELYQELQSKGHNRFGGIFTFTLPRLLVMDPELIKSILTKDFLHWMDRGFFLNERVEPLTAHLFSLEGQRWRNLRQKLTPTFSSAKIKQMFQILVDCSDELDVVMQEHAENKVPVDVKDILSRFTTDVIGSCAFGLNCNSLKNPNAEFRKYGRKIFETDFIDTFKRNFMFSNKYLTDLLSLHFIPNDAAQFFVKVITETTEYRQKNNVTRKDFLQLLIDMKNNDLKNPEINETCPRPMSMTEMTAQAFIFFAAGFETTSSAMTFCLLELARNPDIQEKVRNEVEQVLAKHDGKITYDAITEMHYMEQVVNETLRMYPPAVVLQRDCTQEYIIPDTKLRVPKGLAVFVPVYAIHHDPQHYPEPEKFDPERFSEDVKKSRHPYAFLPFGEGPRNCIGLRFGIMEVKVGLTVLLKSYEFTVNTKTSLPIEFDPKSIVLCALGGIWLTCTKV